MKKKVIVISLGGSLIVPKKIDYKFLHGFKKALEKNFKHYKFAVVCGGGIIARKYISALKKEGKSERELASAGIRATRMNARFMMQLFGSTANETIPKSMIEISTLLKKNKVVFSGALRYAKKETSDGTAAKLARYFKTDFINLTDVSGLYNKNPKKHKNAKLISKITWKDFNDLANSIKFKPGQNFVLDQNAATIIKKARTRTLIIGGNLSNLNKALHGEKFIGTIIEG